MFNDSVTPKYLHTSDPWLRMCPEGVDGGPCMRAFGSMLCCQCGQPMTGDAVYVGFAQSISPEQYIRALRQLRGQEKGKQMELNKGDRVRVEFEATVSSVGDHAVSVNPDTWEKGIMPAIHKSWVKEVIERAAPKVGDVVGKPGADQRIRVIAVDGDFAFGRYVEWLGTACRWVDAVFNGQSHGIARIDGPFFIERAKS